MRGKEIRILAELSLFIIIKKCSPNDVSQKISMRGEEIRILAELSLFIIISNILRLTIHIMQKGGKIYKTTLCKMCVN